MTADERIRAILATLDADIAALSRLRALVAAALEAGALEPGDPGNSPAPAPTLRLVPEPSPPVATAEPRSKYMRQILPHLAAGPLTYAQIANRIGKAQSYWWGAFSRCPWFCRASPPDVRPWLWRLTEAGRLALAGPQAGPVPASSAGTATGATSPDPGDCAGDATTVPA